MTAFQKAFKEHESTFLTDSTHFLILRLRHFVIKTALRTITLAYSRISLADICIKLHLDSEEDTEYIVAKAIKDGVIDATIDHVEGYMQSRIARDMYETEEPAKQFNRRVEHLTGLYNETVRAMRYPPNAHRKGEPASAYMAPSHISQEPVLTCAACRARQCRRDPREGPGNRTDDTGQRCRR